MTETDLDTAPQKPLTGADDLANLLENARKVATFGVYAGVDHAGGLFAKEHRVRESVSSGAVADPDDVESICKHTALVLRDCQISLADLEGWNDRTGRFRSSVGSYFFIVLFAVLTFIACWHFTTWDTQARRVVSDAQDFDFTATIAAERSFYKWLGTSIQEDSRAFTPERAYSDWITGSSLLADFEEHSREYRRVESALASLQRSYFPLFRFKTGLGNFICTVGSGIPAIQRAYCPAVSTPYTPSEAARMQSVLQSPAPEGQQLEDRSEGVDVDAKLLELGLDPSDFNRYYNPPVDRCQSISRVLLDDFRQAIGNDRVDLETALFEWEIKRGPFFITHLLCARIGKWPFISYQFTQPAFKDLQNVESKLREISDWILPSLYGALGAVLFSLSRVLSALSPNPPFNRFMIRLMAGAFAGFATVKFFTPDVASSVGLGWLVSFGQLLLAFLAGYAVESLLKLLTDAVSRARLTWAVPDRAARRTTDGNDKLFEP